MYLQEKKVVQWRVRRCRQLALSRVPPHQRFTQRSLLPTAIVHASPFNVLTINLHVICYTL